MTVRLLCLGDLHLGPSDSLDVEGLELAERGDVDIVVTVGDVIDDNVDHADSAADGLAYEERGRAFFERLDDAPPPVVAVPGNHDPVATTEQLAEGLDSVLVAHERIVTREDHPDLPPAVSIVGWGCERFDLTGAFPYTRYPATDPTENATPETIHQSATEAVETLLSVLGRFLDGALGAEAAVEALGIDSSNAERAREDLQQLRMEYDRLHSLLSSAPDPTVCLSHESPFGTAFDRHHGAESLYGRVHTGSIVLRLALAATTPVVTLSGHTHVSGHDAVRTVDEYRDLYNPGSPGVALVEVDQESETVQVTPDPNP